ncbi:cytidyltransferase-related domain protein [Thermodesulfatator indicus DSM 15286]|uniref:Cytidyltransferase-related domain protein n=1 Tax=Thermodesulfatator indicus (strain DSM 15286 / JCM 11887 / CIR29812) TaxID=667014 RepID=F8AD00_THEID|nr:adenylyltransferase/cytidyltransferase family protein [Thermodesulfatator indicus]AEH45866.1 cytidyltransferase-related domain protein [Thermodesulfatator indicus DSM 15286]
MKPRFGVVHGRFQIFHLDHLKYVKAAAERCEHLVVGITNPDPERTKFDPADPKRSSKEANPFTYFERYLMIRASLLEERFNPKKFSIVLFPINFPELWEYYVPLNAVFYLTIYDDWGRKKLTLFRQKGLKVEVLWEKPIEEKGITATEVRNLIKARDEAWKNLVPKGTVKVIEELGLAERLKEEAC